MSNGATIWSRDTTQSDIFFYKPDKWFKIWFFIVNKVNYTDNKLFKRGENLITYSEIMSAVKCSKTIVHKCLKYMERDNMIDNRKTTRGMIISVKNYGNYQNLDTYKTTRETTRRQLRDNSEVTTITNKEKEREENKEIDTVLSLFNSLFGSNYKTTSGRITKLSQRLKVYNLDQILQAIKNLAGSEFHKGKNDRGWKADPDFLLRSDEQVDKWLNSIPATEAKPKRQFYLPKDMRERGEE